MGLSNADLALIKENVLKKFEVPGLSGLVNADIIKALTEISVNAAIAVLIEYETLHENAATLQQD